jgi:hypothetical protein
LLGFGFFGFLSFFRFVGGDLFAGGHFSSGGGSDGGTESSPFAVTVGRTASGETATASSGCGADVSSAEATG